MPEVRFLDHHHHYHHNHHNHHHPPIVPLPPSPLVPLRRCLVSPRSSLGSIWVRTSGQATLPGTQVAAHSTPITIRFPSINFRRVHKLSKTMQEQLNLAHTQELLLPVQIHTS